jgi:hypothetical protein
MFVVKCVGSSSNGSAPSGSGALSEGGWDSAVVGATVEAGAAVEIGAAAAVDDGAAGVAVVESLGVVSVAWVELLTGRESPAHEVASRMATTRTEEQLM